MSLYFFFFFSSFPSPQHHHHHHHHNERKIPLHPPIPPLCQPSSCIRPCLIFIRSYLFIPQLSLHKHKRTHTHTHTLSSSSSIPLSSQTTTYLHPVFFKCHQPLKNPLPSTLYFSYFILFFPSSSFHSLYFFLLLSH